MTVHEIELSPREEIPPARNIIEKYKMECTPTFSAQSILTITSDFLHSNNISALFLDAEGTFVEFGQVEPSPQITQHIRNVRRFYQEKHDKSLLIAIVTNKRPKDPASFVALAHWGSVLEADVVMTPLTPDWRKPSERMLEEGMKYLGIAPEESRSVLMIGDKLTGDIRSANRADVQSLWIDTIVGTQENLGDKLFRRPWEYSVLRRAIQENPLSYMSVVPETEDFVPTSDTELPEEMRINWWSKDNMDMVLDLPNSLYGYGVPAEMRNQTLLGSRYLYEHGGEIADLMSDLQIVFAAGAALAEIKKYPYVAASLKTLKALMDVVDGWIARRSKRGATKKGGEKDQIRDKQASAITELGMVASGNLNPSELILRSSADLVMNRGIRSALEKDRVDPSAVWSGKVATSIVNTVDILSPLIGNYDPFLAKVLNEVATTAKFVRLPLNGALMLRRHDLRMAQIHDIERAFAQLAPGFQINS